MVKRKIGQVCFLTLLSQNTKWKIIHKVYTPLVFILELYFIFIEMVFFILFEKRRLQSHTHT